jgi:proteasome lid subunit RPN8/RPN11
LSAAFTLTQAQLDQILEQAQAEAPHEACGLLAGREGRVTHVLPARNAAERPAVAYLVDAHDQLRHFDMMEAQGLDLLGIYHSHPHSPAYPSPTDMELAYYPEAVYLIISLMHARAPALRAFRMLEGQVHEVEFAVTDNS